MSENFYSKMQNTVSNVSVTENGMVGYKTTNNPLVDFNFKVSSFRGHYTEGLAEFKKVLDAGDKYALKYLMYLRDAREGLGERDLFRVCMLALLASNVANKDEIVDTLLTTIPVYGRYDDLLVLFVNSVNDKVRAKTVDFIKNQLATDFENYKANKPISLLAKWMPSENASSPETVSTARALIKALKTTPKEYRKTLATLRKYLNVVETKTCAKEWSDIDYNAVPSKANIKYMNAFLKHDEARRREFLAKALVGDKTVKVNMSVTFPHEIVTKYRKNGWNVGNYDMSLEAYWNNLKACDGLKDTIVVRDGSGSMTSRIGGTNTTALDVSTALAIYCSQFGAPGFRNKFITFGRIAELVDLSDCGSLHTKLQKAYEKTDYTNTNLSNVFKLILKTAINNHMSQEDIPGTVLIISDMEFDSATSGYGLVSNVIDAAASEFKAYGYDLPKLAFWNVCSRTKTIPCTYNKNGVLLISGFSQNVVSLVMNGESDPYEAIIHELNKDRYAMVPFVSYDKTPEVVTKTTAGTKRVYKKKVTVKAATPTFLKR